MRVLLVVSEMPPVASGVSRCASRLVHGLTQRGHEVDVLSSADIRRWTFGEVRLSSMAAHWPRLARRLGSYDVVNVHGPVPTMSDVFLALSRTLPPIGRPPLVYTHHSSIDLAGWDSACRAYNRIHRRLARSADRVITTTDSYQAIMTTRGGPPVHVVPWGVDAFHFTAARESPRPLGHPLRVLFVGQMRPYKGTINLVRAVAGEPGIELTMAGSGPMEEQIRRTVEGAGAYNTRMLGHVSDEQLARLYAAHDVIALPSTTRAEAFGMTLLEGMAAGCTPLASDLPGVRDLAGPTGVLVRPGDIADLRDALRTLAADPERTWKLGRASQARAHAMGWDGVAEGYEQVFRHALMDWRAQRASAALSRTWLPPDHSLASIAGVVGASWSSLLLFSRLPRPIVRSGWGHLDVEAIHQHEPRIAAYVAETGRPLLIDEDRAPSEVRTLLVREDIASAISVPVRSARGTVGVLNLSIASGESRRFTTRDLDAIVRLVA